jgi:hypothetical protein
MTDSNAVLERMLKADSSVVVEHLRKARALYASAPSHAYPWDYPEDNTYCLLTALEAAGWTPAAFRVLRAEADTYLAWYNAEHSTEEVLSLFDRAIECAAVEGKGR